MKSFCLTFVAVFCAYSLSVYANSLRQENLKKRGIVFAGWQDEGLLKIREDLPKHQRLSSNEFHSLVDKLIAQDRECQSRNVANEDASQLPEYCR